ncbi:MAG: undecaprenyl-diphosphate phosphatase [Calditrichaeota bacterium]|nr:MAG: undecaprenyl-diphosphate phosphatase [Calditrichota bacterium]
MIYWHAILLGLIQGLTEFLPVSSSGHLVLAQAVLGIHNSNIVFEVFAHFGTLLAVLTIFKQEIRLLFKGLKAIVSFRFHRPRPEPEDDEGRGLQLLGLLVVGTVPAAVVGYLFESSFEEAFSHPQFVCWSLLVTGAILLLSRLARERVSVFSPLRALGVGVAQIFAILPGISRSGTTISAAMLLGVERVEAARFSFLLAVPLIFGATLLKSLELFRDPPGAGQLLVILLGMVTAYLSGLFAIKWLLAVIRRDRFDRFAYYCFALGLAGLLIIHF